MIRRIGQFLHILDEDGRLDLSDIAFMIIMGKIAFASVLDWTAVITLAVVLVNKMHKRQQIGSEEVVNPTISEAIKSNEQAMKSLEEKIAPIVELVKGKLT